MEAGFSEGTIIKRIEDSPAEFDLSPPKLIELRKRRVTDAIITAMTAAMDDSGSKTAARPEAGTTSRMSGKFSISCAHLFSELALCLAACLCNRRLSPLGNAQDPDAHHRLLLKLKQKEQDIDPDDVISVNTTEVLLPVTVRDSTGQLVTNLTRTDFRVFEDGVEQPLSDLSLRQVPVDVVLMVDASSSVVGQSG